MNEELAEQKACDPAVTRSEFIKKLVERASVAGALVAVPAIVDSFIAPPAIASSSSGQFGAALSLQKPIA